MKTSNEAPVTAQIQWHLLGYLLIFITLSLSSGSVCLVTCSLHALSAYTGCPMFERLDGYPIFQPPIKNYLKNQPTFVPSNIFGRVKTSQTSEHFFGTPCMYLRSPLQQDDTQRDITCHQLSASCDQQICDIIFWASPYHLIISSLASYQPQLCEEFQWRKVN